MSLILAPMLMVVPTVSPMMAPMGLLSCCCEVAAVQQVQGQFAVSVLGLLLPPCPPM